MLALFRDARAVALLMAASLTILSNTIISPGLPGLAASFPDQPNAELLTRLLVTAPSLLVAITAPFAGMTADRFGRRVQLLAGVILFAIAGVAGAFLPTLPLILASRLLLGLAVAMIMTAQAALIGDYFTGEKRDRFMGLQISAVNFGGFIFIALAGWLAGFSPRYPFLIYALGAVFLPFLWITLVEPPRADLSFASDDEAPQTAWVGTLVMVLVFSGLCFILFYAIPTQLPFHLAAIGLTRPAIAALALSLVMLAGGFSAILFGAVRARLGGAATPALGLGVMAAGFGLLAIANSTPPVLVATLLIGAGFGLVMPNFISIALTVAPPHRRGAASGAITTSIFLGQFLSPLASQPLISALGYRMTFGVGSGLLMLLAALVYAMFRRL